MVQPASDEPIHQIDVTLQETDPAVWRRLLLPGRTTLQRLHRILQVAMGWTDSHLYLFNVGEREYGLPDDDWDDLDIHDARRYRLGQAAPSVGDRFVYEYDMGDGWRHDVRVTAIRPPAPWEHYPLCIAGARACPPEDCGGTYGYAELLRVIADPSDDEHESTLTWLGGIFDPAAFDLNTVNRRLHRLPLARP